MNRPDKVYQLCCTGTYKCFNSVGVMRSKQVYASSELAAGAAEEFKKCCCGPGLFDFVFDTATVVVTELDMVWG